MRAQHIIAVVIVLLIGFGVKLTFFNAPAAEADSIPTNSISMDIPAMHENAQNIPMHRVHDMSFVFADGD